MSHILNFKQSPDDERDFIFTNEKLDNLKNTFPVELDLRNELMPVRNQGSQGTCYAQSAACMKEWQEKHNYDNNEYFSPQFFYNLRSNKYDENTNNDEGMYGRDVMILLKTYGICPEQLYPYGKIEDRGNISVEIYEKAKLNVIDTYARIYTIDDLKMSLFLNGPAIIGFPVYNYSDQMWKKNGNENMKGGHAMTIVGYTELGFIIRNSWGDNWNEDGYTTYYYNDWGAHWEVWSTVDKKDIFPPEPVPVDPEPVDPVDPEPVDPEPVDPVDPEPVDPVDPVPVDPVPVDPQTNLSVCEKLFRKLFG